MKRTLEEYKRDYPIGSKVVVVYTVVSHETDPDDEYPIEARGRGEGSKWLHHGDLDGLDYDDLVSAVDLDQLLAAIERRVGNPTTVRRHWKDLKVGDTVTMPDGSVGEVTMVEPPSYDGDRPEEIDYD